MKWISLTIIELLKIYFRNNDEVNYLWKGMKRMVEITVKINFNGKNYQTNVIVDRSATKEEVLCLAQEQVRKQWTL